MNVILSILYYALYAYSIVLLIRVAVDFALVVFRRWTPGRFAVMVFEMVFTITDPPIKVIRRILPPVRFGQVMLDFGVFGALIVCNLCMVVVAAFL